MRFGILVDKMANYLSTEIVAVSEVVKDILISNEGVKPEKVRLIYNGIELEKFQNVNTDNTKAGYGPKKADNLFNIGVISRLTELKGVEYIAQAFVKLHAEFPNSRLHIVGAFSDSYSEVLKTLSPIDLGAYTIEKEKSDIPSFFGCLDVFIHVPVGVQDEAFGIVYIEALASGVACIFTQSGVLNELDDAQRYVALVSPRDSEAIYSNLRKMLLGLSTIRTPIPNVWIKQFSLEKIAKNYADLIIGA
jgi:glycosyltransferase involved in cell wall biosynthesis